MSRTRTAPTPEIIVSPPQEQVCLIGHKTPWHTLCEAYQNKRLPGAWLITGTKGIGKATMAYRFARLLLSNIDANDTTTSQISGPLSTPSEHSFRQIAHHSHPDMMVISPKIDPKTGKRAKEIHVDDIREIGSFLHLTSSDSPFRLILIDSADDLNHGAANALLKMLEEPPRGAYFILINHHPGSLLETIRSRCRAIPCQPLKTDELTQVLDHLVAKDGVTYDSTVVSLSDGSVAQALALSRETMMHCFEHWCAFFAHLPRINSQSLDAIVAQISKTDNDEWHQAIALADRLLSKAMLAGYSDESDQSDNTKNALKGLYSQPFEHLVQAHQSLNHMASQTISLNLDKRNSLLTWAVKAFG